MFHIRHPLQHLKELKPRVTVVLNFRHPPKFLAERTIRRAIVLAYLALCLRPYVQIRLRARDPNPNQSILKINLLCLWFPSTEGAAKRILLENYSTVTKGIISSAVKKSIGEISKYDTGPVAIWRTYNDISRFEVGELNVLFKDPALKVHNRL